MVQKRKRSLEKGSGFSMSEKKKMVAFGGAPEPA